MKGRSKALLTAVYFRALGYSPFIVQLAAPFGMAGCVDGYADKDERHDNQ